MASAAASIPSSAVIAAVFVLLYSIICLTCGFLLVFVLYLSKDKFSYIFLLAVSTTCSTIFNIIQQINYLANWHTLRVQQYEASLAAYDKPSLALGPLSKGFNEALFWIVLYFYNVDSMLMLFWAIALVSSVWNWKSPWVHKRKSWIGISSKIAAWILPAFIVGLRKSYQLHLTFASAVVLLNILMLCSFSIGTICVMLILGKYLSVRLSVGNYATGTLPTDGVSQRAISRGGWSGLKMRVDPWLVLRFTIAFIILSALEVFLVTFEIRRYHNIQVAAKVQAPNFGAAATISDILNYIPGVTASLLVFLLFGTTGPLRSIYVSMLNMMNICKRTRPTIHGNAPRGTDDQIPMTQDIEMTGRSRITKGTSVQVSVNESASTSNEFDRQICSAQAAWYPGRKIGILDDP